MKRSGTGVHKNQRLGAIVNYPFLNLDYKYCRRCNNKLHVHDRSVYVQCNTAEYNKKKEIQQL